MSAYLNAFLTLNLAAEMVYVIAQRLNAQDVALDRSAFVLNEIVAALASKETVTDIMTPRAIYSHGQVKEIIGDIAQSSIMRLDATSMDKLWDLVATVFKWQLTLGADILKITQRHVSDLEDYISNGEVLLQLRKVQNIVVNFGAILTDNELTRIREEILAWLSPSAVKVSLLLRLGLQNVDGSFVIDNHSGPTKDVVRNLGQNIYALPQSTSNESNRKVADQTTKRAVDDAHPDNSDEVDLLVHQLLGEQQFGLGPKSPESSRLRLNICDRNENVTTKRRKNAEGINFQRCDIGRGDDNVKLNDLLADLNINGGNFSNDAPDFKDDLFHLMDSSGA